ncbi:MAG: DNA-binding protein [Blastocatellia bacterium]
MRTRNAAILLSAAISALLLVATALAQNSGWRNYNPSTETTIKGTVGEVKQITGRGGGLSAGTHLTVRTDKGNLQVHVGPAAWLEKQRFTFAKGDQLEVLGSKVTQAGQEILLAREIRKDSKTLTLRNAQGIPAWSRGWRNQ